LANDRREVQRRIKEAELREVLLNDLQNESQLSSAKFDEVSSKWSEMDGVLDPIEIHDNLECQKSRINELIDQKMTIINECRDELNSADTRYVKDMDKHTSDINCLVERIDKQMDVMKRTYREHLDLLEKTIDDERKILQIVTTKKWEAMYDKRSVNEETKMRREAEKAEFYSNELQRIQLEHEELIRATKIRLENDNQALEIEVQKLKRNIMLNSEKLEYNFQVLKKREDENVMVRNQQKRRLSKLADTIVSLKRKLKEAKSTCITETKKFTADIMKLHAKILDLERKSDLFAEQNNKKYLTVWEINYEECEKAMDQVLKIDKMLWEQQLNLEWERPNVQMIRREELDSFKMAMEKINGPTTENDVDDVAGNAKALVPISAEQTLKTREQQLMEQKLMKIIFRAIADNSGFLIEGKLKNLLMPYTRTEQTLVNLDAVFNALGIVRSNEIDYIKNYFAPFASCKKCNNNPFAENYPEEVSRNHIFFLITNLFFIF
jgi:dynein regulatory complex protein 1